jgi:PAS domain S-box-containing protein
LSFSAGAQLYTFEVLNHKDGLSMAGINVIMQTDNGMLYIGTDGSELYAYDGQSFTSLLDTNNFHFHHVESLSESGDSILFASRYKGFYTYYPNKEKYIEYIPVKRLKGEHLYFENIGDNQVLISSCNIQLESDGEVLFNKAFNDCSLDIQQVIRTRKSIILLTNKGNYRVSENGIRSLGKWLKNNDPRIDQMAYGFYYKNTVTLWNEQASERLNIVLNNDDTYYSTSFSSIKSPLHEDEKIIALSHNPISNKAACITSRGFIYSIVDNKFQFIVNNSGDDIGQLNNILTDRNGDLWVCTWGKGIVKVAQEPFTKLKMLEAYQNGEINLPYRTAKGKIILSHFNGDTKIIDRDGSTREFDFKINSVSEFNGSYYLATNRGLKRFDDEKNIVSDFSFNNRNITLVHKVQDRLLVGLASDRLLLLNTETKEVQEIDHDSQKVPAYYYTAQTDSKRGVVYLGTNDGIFKYNVANNKLSREAIKKNLGSYSGVSTRDASGRMWFTLEEGLVGFDQKGNHVYLDAVKYCGTNLFYTLQADQNGNLFVGTNKGMTLIEVDADGEVLSSQHFNSENGFGGFETHMRSQFESESGLFVGTIQGLFQITPQLLEDVPEPPNPIIKELIEAGDSNQDNNLSFSVIVYNPKLKNIQYIYRIPGVMDTWKDIDGERIDLYDVPNGDHVLEVRASYNGVHYSDTSSYPFSVTVPFWQTRWFILVVILSVIAINIILLQYNRAFNTSRLIDTKDTVVHLRMTPGILLFATLAVTGSHLISPIIDPELTLHLGPTIAVGFALTSLFILSLFVRKSENKQRYNLYLIIGLVLIQLHFFYEVFVSNLHPFHIIGVVLVSMVVPYILSNIRAVVIYSILTLGVALSCAIVIDEPVYSKTYFLVAMFIMACLLIFISYLRYNSLEKLMFISGIINKGNLPAISFDRDGKVNYVSENISLFANIDHEELLNKNITYLNKFVPYEGEFKETDVVSSFNDGEKYTVPMTNSKNEVRWVEWSYKNFSKDVNVMIGQDVSDKLELENTYELLVQNAEDFIYRCDINGNFLFVNNTFYEKLGYSAEDIINKPATRIVDSASLAEVESYYSDHFKKNKSSSYKEFPIRTKEGALIWIGQYVTTLYAAGSDKFIKGFIALARDITELKAQQELILEQRDNITDSINYAKRIQNNLLPHEREFTSLFKEQFIIYKPKDIVSGDFYWVEDLGDTIILALADCTGHGVPGSFMTLLGINLLNTIVHEDKIQVPGEILDRLDERLVEVLPRGEGENRVKDGMEITICAIDKSSNTMSFACAGSRFLIYNETGFTMYKGDIKHIGDEQYEGFVKYQTNYTKLDQKDQLYLITDGFQDQFGGPNDKKFSFRRMLDLFESCQDLPLNNQRDVISKEYDRWIGKGEQTDDLSVVSIRRRLF